MFVLPFATKIKWQYCISKNLPKKYCMNASAAHYLLIENLPTSAIHLVLRMEWNANTAAHRHLTTIPFLRMRITTPTSAMPTSQTIPRIPNMLSQSMSSAEYSTISNRRLQENHTFWSRCFRTLKKWRLLCCMITSWCAPGDMPLKPHGTRYTTNLPAYPLRHHPLNA